MNRTPRWRSLALAVGVATSVGCAASPPPGRVYVVDRPPPTRVEVIPVRPGHAYVWVPGYWTRAPRGYTWVPGRYVVPPARHRTWVNGSWHHDRRGWYYVEGHWR
jgi:hypothetical protein